MIVRDQVLQVLQVLRVLQVQVLLFYGCLRTPTQNVEQGNLQHQQNRSYRDLMATIIPRRRSGFLGRKLKALRTRRGRSPHLFHRRRTFNHLCGNRASPRRNGPNDSRARRGRQSCWRTSAALDRSATSAQEAHRATRASSTRYAGGETPPRAFVSSSAIGHYGAHGDEPVTEQTRRGTTRSRVVRGVGSAGIGAHGNGVRHDQSLRTRPLARRQPAQRDAPPLQTPASAQRSGSDVSSCPGSRRRLGGDVAQLIARTRPPVPST